MIARLKKERPKKSLQYVGQGIPLEVGRHALWMKERKNVR